MKKGKVPRQIQNILTEDEGIEKSFVLKGRQVYTTEKRLLVIEGRTIRDFDYAHISSVTYSSKRYWWLIILGIFLIPLIIGIILIIVGILRKSEWVEVNIVGISNPVRFQGSRDELDSLLRIIRQKQILKRTINETQTGGD